MHILNDNNPEFSFVSSALEEFGERAQPPDEISRRDLLYSFVLTDNDRRWYCTCLTFHVRAGSRRKSCSLRTMCARQKSRGTPRRYAGNYAAPEVLREEDCPKPAEAGPRVGSHLRPEMLGSCQLATLLRVAPRVAWASLSYRHHQKAHEWSFRRDFTFG